MTDIPINRIAVSRWNRADSTRIRKANGAKAACHLPFSGLAGVTFPKLDEAVMPGTQTPFADIHLLDLGPNGGLLAPEVGFCAPPIRTISLKILAGAPAALGDKAVSYRLAFSALHPLPTHIIPPPARLRIRLTAASRQKLLRSTLGRTVIGDHIVIPDMLGCIGGIVLQPGETLPILLEYETDYLDEGSALRVLQYAGEAGSERLTGVQIYVFTGISR